MKPRAESFPKLCMKNPLAELDAILRAQRVSIMAPGTGSATITNKRLLLHCVALGAIYGLFMGFYSLSMRGTDGMLQLVASTAKLPLLFMLTLCVTFPSMYVFSALAWSRLDPRRTLFLLHSLSITLALAASFAPILGFFTLSTRSYHFMGLLNVGFLACAGIVGCVCLSRSLTRLLTRPVWVDSAPVPPVAEPSPENPFTSSPVFPRSAPVDPATFVLQIWIVLCGLVGAQMGWVLRPFIGSPDQPFSLFRERSGNVLRAVGGVLLRLIGVDGGSGR